MSSSVWLTLLSIIPSRSIQVVANGKISFFFLWLSSIPLCIYHHIFFIHSPIDGHLGHFHVLAMYIMLLWTLWCMYLFELVFLFSLDIYPGVELLDHMVVLFLIFWGTSILFSMVAAPTYIPTSSARGFPFPSSSPTFNYLLSFWWWPFWQVWGDISHCGFEQIFLFSYCWSQCF